MSRPPDHEGTGTPRPGGRLRWGVLRVGLWISLVGIVCVILLGAYVWRQVSPARLHPQFVALLTEAVGTPVEIGDVSMPTWGQIRLDEIAFTAPDPEQGVLQAGMIGSIDVNLEPVSLLLNQPEVRRIVLRDGVLTLSVSPSALEAMPERTPDRSGVFEPSQLPRIQLSGVSIQVVDSADVAQVVRLGPLLTDLQIEGGVERDADGVEMYALRLARIGDSAASGTLLEALMRAPSGETEIRSTWIPLSWVQALLDLPALEAVRAQIEPYGVDGEARLVRAMWGSSGVERAEIEIRNLSAAAPFEGRVNEAGVFEPTPRALRMMRLDGGALSLRWVAPEFEATLSGAVDSGELAVVARGVHRPSLAAAQRAATPAPRTSSMSPSSASGRTRSGSPPAPRDVAAALGDALAEYDLEVDAKISGLSFPGAAREPQIAYSPRIPGPARALLKDYAPRGRFDLGVSFAQRGRDRPSDLGDSVAAKVVRSGALTIRPRGARCVYRHFPYEMVDATGVLEVREGQVHLDLAARHRGGAVQCRGMLESTTNWTAFDLTFSGTRVPMDRELYTALPDEYRTLWDQTRPIGYADAVVRVTRPMGTPESGPREVEVTVEADLPLVSLEVEGGRVTQGRMRLRVDEDGFHIDQLVGAYGGADLLLAGRVGPGAAQAENWHYAMAGMPVETLSQMGGGQPGMDAGDPDALSFRGEVNVWGNARRERETDLRLENVAQVTDGELVRASSEVVWQAQRGLIRSSPELLLVDELVASDEQTTVTGRGALLVAERGFTPNHLELRAETEALQSLVERLVPQRWVSAIRALGFVGAGSVEMDLDSEVGSNPEATLNVIAESMRPEAFPLPLRNIAARIRVDEQGFALEQLESVDTDGSAGLIAEVEAGGSLQVVSGSGAWSEDPPTAALAIRATQIPLVSEVIDALPGVLPKLMRALEPREGRITRAVFDDVMLTFGEPARWSVLGEMDFEAAALDLGLELSEFSGTLSTRPPGFLIADSDGTRGEIQFSINSGALAGRPIRAVTGLMTIQPDSDQIAVDQVVGSFCDGELRGAGMVNPETAAYEIRVALSDVDPRQFLTPPERRAPDEDASAPEQGPVQREPSRIDNALLSGEIFVRGRGSEVGSRRGGGVLQVVGLKLLGTPVLEEVAEASAGTRRQLVDSANRIVLRFDWVGSVLELRQVQIVSGTTELRGKGRWDLATNRIELQLLAAPLEAPGSPLEQLINIAIEELVQYRVSGTVDEPRVTLEPLHNVREAIEEAFGG